MNILMAIRNHGYVLFEGWTTRALVPVVTDVPLNTKETVPVNVIVPIVPAPKLEFREEITKNNWDVPEGITDVVPEIVWATLPSVEVTV